MGYNLAHNPIGMVPTAPLSSTLGKELHPPILSTLAIHGGQVKIERDNVTYTHLKQIPTSCGGEEHVLSTDCMTRSHTQSAVEINTCV